MDQLLALFDAHGVPAIFLLVLAKRMGVPVPALPVLLLAGARGVDDGLFALQVLLAASAAAILADELWFHAGRRYGRAMLALLCRISMAPGHWIRTSERAFERRGAVAVLLAKFIPGVAGLAPPLAGALGMRTGSFTALNGAGTLLWVGSGLAAGLLLHRQVAQVIGALEGMGSAALPVLALALAAYVGWLALRRLLVVLAVAKAPRLQPQDLAEMIARGEPVVLVDVRGPGAAAGARIAGALHATVDSEAFEGLSAHDPAVPLVTYCDCPSEISAARAALKLRQRGIPAQVLAGGVAAWVEAKLPVEGGGQGQVPPLNPA